MIASVVLSIFFLLVVAFRLHLLVYVSRLVGRWKGKLPPGPFSWPVVGALGIDPKAPWEMLTEWSKYFGPVTGFFYGSEYTIVLSDMESVKATMKNAAFDGRPLNHSSKEFFGKSIGFAEGETWKKHRKLVVSSLRVLGSTGSQQMLFDDHLKHCAWNLVLALQENRMNAFDPKSLLNHAVVHVMSFLIFKDTLTPADPRFQKAKECCKMIFSVNSSTDVLNTMPFLRHLPPFKSHTDLFNKANKDLLSITRDVIKDRKRFLEDCRRHDRVEEAEPVDFTEAMFREQNLASLYGDLTDEEITVMAAELYLAGTEDTTIVFHWLILLLAYYPEVQKKLQVHIDSVIGHSRAPALFDRPSLVYLEAVVLETMRFSNSIPFPLPHRVTEDTNLLSYRIPKDTAVIVNFYALNISSQYWDEPLIFRPERFLNADGKLNSLGTQVMGFGEGRRSCPGERVAMITLAVLLATIFQNLSLSFPDGVKPKLSLLNGTTAQPPAYKIIATPRHIPS